MDARRLWLIWFVCLVVAGTIMAPFAYAFECPIRHKEARQMVGKARAASQQVTDPEKLAAIEQLLEQAEERLRESESTHFEAKNNADHATSVRRGYEALGSAKEAYYLATK
jgi:hypothetical protein